MLATDANAIAQSVRDDQDRPALGEVGGLLDQVDAGRDAVETDLSGELLHQRRLPDPGRAQMKTGRTVATFSRKSVSCRGVSVCAMFMKARG